MASSLSDCIPWHGRVRADGYGTLGVHMAHRRAYEAQVGPIPPGMELDHLCKRRDCVNVEHLEPVTRWENIRRSDVGRVNRAKTHCPAGHPYEESNTRYDRRGSRYCLACKRRKRAEWGARKRAA